MLTRSRYSKLNRLIQEDHINGSSSGIEVCDELGFEPQKKRQKEDHIVGSSSGIQICDKQGFESQNDRQQNVDNVCSTSTNTVQTSANVVTFDNPNQISKGQANFQINKKGKLSFNLQFLWVSYVFMTATNRLIFSFSCLFHIFFQ